MLTLSASVVVSVTMVVNSANSLFVVHPTDQTSVAQGLFLGESGHRAIAQTHPAAPKIPWAPSAFPEKRPPQVPGNKSSPLIPWGELEPGGTGDPVIAHMIWILASRKPCQVASTDCHENQDTPKLIRVPSHTVT